MRCMRVAVALGLILSMAARDARAQWSHGGWGWAGWDTAQMKGFPEDPGFYAMGAGIHHDDPRVNAGLVAKYNGHVAGSTWNVRTVGPLTKEQAEQLRKVYFHKYQQPKNADARRASKGEVEQFMRAVAVFERYERECRENPTAKQVQNGDALNVAVADLSDPRLGSLALRAAKVPVAASLIAEVPFASASERVTFMLDELRAAVRWPRVFPAERFADAKRTFDDLVVRMQNEDQAGDISAKSLEEAQAFVNALGATLIAQPLANHDDQTEAMRFVSAFRALVGLLKKPDIRPAISALRKLKDTSLGNLLGFLHAYNLRFGPATTPKENEAYHQLFAILDKTRDEVLAEVKPGGVPTADADPRNVADFFDVLDTNKRKSKNLSGAIEFPNPK